MTSFNPVCNLSALVRAASILHCFEKVSCAVHNNMCIGFGLQVAKQNICIFCKKVKVIINGCVNVVVFLFCMQFEIFVKIMIE